MQYKSIEDFFELSSMAPGTVLYHINMGSIISYIIVGVINQAPNSIILVEKDCINKNKVLRSRDLEKGYWCLNYNTKKVGEIMIQQINDYAKKEIEAITVVYINK